ncbi:VOC family protein [Cohnella nanjingensis]|uniref:VOC family protein n=1 Tax=Cohnella nanjingensis TaxID=1387779 RepID=A0A7X0RQG8_9BACL|nr:VOC family protein [Cohnella nanjingensis]MBB6671777.1 VOC family protein [Cohnella nanjingensis]
MTHRIHPDTEMGRVSLKVSDLQRSIRYYREVIGLRLLSEEGPGAAMSADGEAPLLLLEQLPDAVVPARRRTTGLYHFAILVPTRRALGLAVRNFIERGEPFGQGDHLVSEALYLSDPDGNGIEVYVDRPRDEWTYSANGEVAMATDPVDIDGLLREAGDEAWTGLPAGTKIGHVHLHVADLAASQRFYCGILGFDLMARYGGQALFVSAGGYHHHLGLNTWAGAGAPPPPANAVGLRYFEIAIPNEAELIRILDDLRDAGIPAEPYETGWLVRDPSQNQLLLLVR